MAFTNCESVRSVILGIINTFLIGIHSKVEYDAIIIICTNVLLDCVNL